MRDGGYFGLMNLTENVYIWLNLSLQITEKADSMKLRFALAFAFIFPISTSNARISNITSD